MRAVVLGLLLWMFAGASLAEVQLSFYAHPGARVRDGYLLFPHAYVHAVGTIEATGEVVDWSAGFTAANPGPHLLLMKGQGVVAEPDARYVSEGRGLPDRGSGRRGVSGDPGAGRMVGTASRDAPMTSGGATASPSSPIWRGWRGWPRRASRPCGPAAFWRPRRR